MPIFKNSFFVEKPQFLKNNIPRGYFQRNGRSLWQIFSANFISDSDMTITFPYLRFQPILAYCRGYY